MHTDLKIVSYREKNIFAKFATDYHFQKASTCMASSPNSSINHIVHESGLMLI